MRSSNRPDESQDSREPLRLDISSEDLRAYAEGRLDQARRTQVAGFLACNPDLAASVMQEMHLRERSLAAHGGISAPASSLRRAPVSRLVVAGMACAVAGWAFATGLDEDGPLQGLLTAPEYVEDAVMAWHATHLRISMDSQEQTPSLDAAEVRRVTQIRVPALPREWRLLDAQIYPSEAGPGINMLFETTAGGQLNLFAVRSSTAATGEPQIVTRMGAEAAYWEREGAAYVLTGDGSRAQILAHAARLSRSALMQETGINAH
jgi:anti-sigma factor RsiW